MSKRYDVVIVGAGVLGSCIAYWISSTCKASVCVIDKEMLPAEHASSRNTGIVHSPFYLDPKKKSKIAKASLYSYKMWNTIASENKLPWEKTGLLELAIKKEQDATLEKYSKWAVENGIPSEEIQLLDAPQIKKMEPNIRCHSALYCPREVSTDFGALTRSIASESQKTGAEYLMGMHLVLFLLPALTGLFFPTAVCFQMQSYSTSCMNKARLWLSLIFFSDQDKTASALYLYYASLHAQLGASLYLLRRRLPCT